MPFAFGVPFLIHNPESKMTEKISEELIKKVNDFHAHVEQFDQLLAAYKARIDENSTTKKSEIELKQENLQKFFDF